MEERLIKDVYILSGQHPRWGYEKITELLVTDGWRVGRKRIQRLRRREGLKVPVKQQKRKRLGISTTVRQRALYANHVWSWDFLFDRTEDGRRVKIFNIIDEYSRFSIAMEARRSYTGEEVIETLGRAMMTYGIPGCIRSDNGSEFINRSVKKWLRENGMRIMYIEPGSPWENPYVESLNGRLRDECLNRELFASLGEVQVVLNDWREEYNRRRPHGGLNFQTPGAVYDKHITAASLRDAVYPYQPREYSNLALSKQWG